MALFNFGRKAAPTGSEALSAFLSGYSIEVMPRTAEKIEDFRALLPEGTRVYIAHIEGTPIEDMAATARRIREEGFEPMPHFPARIIADKAMLLDWVARYKGEAGVKQGLILAGNPPNSAACSIRRCNFWNRALSTGSNACTSPATPKATRTSTPTGPTAT